MKRLALVVLLALGAWDCNFDPGPSCGTVIIGSRQLDFETPCTGEDCNLATLGATTTVPSLLPGDHALALFASASVTWTLGIPGNGEGTSLAMSYRCEEGGFLVVDLQGTGLAPLRIGGTRDWQRRVWTLQATPSTYRSAAEARTGRHQAVVHVVNSGSALCAVDWLRYVAAPRVCDYTNACSDPSRTYCTSRCVDTLTDVQNCGGCGRVCGSSQSCQNGVCRASCGFCPWNTTCGSDGVCRSEDAGSPFDVPSSDTGGRFDAGRDVVVSEGGDRTAVVAGRRCSDDSMCRTPSADLTCTATIGGRVCSLASGCAGLSGEEAEAQCGGPASVCIFYGATLGSRVTNHCARACTAAAVTEAAGACPTGSVCTSNWVVSIERPTSLRGCLPYCRDDSDCATGGPSDAGARDGDAGTLACNQRTGRCVSSAPTPLAGADGTACNPMLVQTSGVDPCRGTCRLLYRSIPTQGLCASFINLQRTLVCDDPRVRPITRAGDNLGLCAAISCERNAQCSGGLRCVYPQEGTHVFYESPPSCGYVSDEQPNGITG